MSIEAKIAHWFATGHVGVSSRTMASFLGLGIRKGDYSHPHDPDDLDRCLQLLEAVPELRPYIANLAALSPEWEALVRRWDEIERSHLDEVGLRWTKANRAPKTYELMRSVIDSARKRRPHGVIPCAKEQP
jgi:hypothetical protein